MRINVLLGAAIAVGGLLGATSSVRAELATLDAKNKLHVRLRAVTGHVCLKFHEIVRPQIAMKDMYDHVVSVENGCPETILVKVCYKNVTTGCRKLRVSAHKKAAALLGSMNNRPSFGFEYTETYAD